MNDFWNALWTSAEPKIIEAIITVLGVMLTALTFVVVRWVLQLRNAVIAKMTADEYKTTRAIAEDVYNRVEQLFKGQVDVAEQKRAKFEEFLLQKVPGLTKEDIEHFREAVVGAINAGVKQASDSVPIPVPASTSPASVPEVTGTSASPACAVEMVNEDTGCGSTAVSYTNPSTVDTSAPVVSVEVKDETTGTTENAESQG